MNIIGNRDCEDGVSFSKNLITRIWSHWFLKAVGTMIFMAVFFSFYLYILKNPYFLITQMPFTIVDNNIEFQPYFLYFYLSLWVYVSLVPALMKSKKELLYYAVYIGTVCAVGIGFYILFPTSIPQNTINWSHYATSLKRFCCLSFTYFFINSFSVCSAFTLPKSERARNLCRSYPCSLK